MEQKTLWLHGDKTFYDHRAGDKSHFYGGIHW